MDRLRDMEVFARVVETGSFSAAARDLNLGQPAVSKTIAALEDRLGIRLLVRSTRRLSPTEAGQAFYELPSAPLQRRTKRKRQRGAPAPVSKAGYESVLPLRLRGFTSFQNSARFSIRIQRFG
jgi:Bacterial regulatory helix-turn-helix protein, lysR family